MMKTHFSDETMSDTACYRQALAEWRATHPTVREADVTMRDRSDILTRAQEMKHWYSGGGCAKHFQWRSGSCHECAMLQLDPQFKVKSA